MLQRKKRKEKHADRIRNGKNLCIYTLLASRGRELEIHAYKVGNYSIRSRPIAPSKPYCISIAIFSWNVLSESR